MRSEIARKLNEYVQEGFYPFHMPGHKRNEMACQDVLRDFVRCDLTEIPGLDNLHDPEGIIREEMDLARDFYGSDESFFLVNGCSGGVLAAITAICPRDSKILVARNCHRSVMNAIELMDLIPYYVYPEYVEPGILGEIKKEDVEKILEKNSDIKCVVITSPTYEGVISDVEAIALVAHRYDAILIVDEAHGAHLDGEIFPKSSLRLGADIVIQGLHKTLPSLTQTGIMHVRSSLVSKDLVGRYLSMYQTTSPSYIFLSSIAEAVRDFRESLLDGRMKSYWQMLTKCRNNLRRLKLLKLFEYDGCDISKIVIMTEGTNITGAELSKRLRDEYRIEVEMAGGCHIICMTSVCDKKEGFERLCQALHEIDDGLLPGESMALPVILKNEIRYVPGELRTRKRDMIANSLAGRIASGSIYVYPPGIPLLVAGEVISDELLAAIEDYKRRGHEIMGIVGDFMEVLADE